MLSVFSLNSIFLLLIALLGAGVALWVYFSNPKARTNQLFLLFTIFNIFWIVFTYFSDITDVYSMASLAILYRNLAYGSVFLFLICTYFFVKFFTKKTETNVFLDTAVVFSGTTLLFISLFTNLIVKGVEPRNWGNYPIFGIGVYVAYPAIILLTILTLYLLIKNYFSLSGKNRIKTQYFILGICIFALGNFICNIILVPWWKNFPYYYLGNYSTFFLIGFTSYAIVKRKLFGIKIVLAILMVIFIAVLLLLDILILTQNATFQFFKLLLLVAFLNFGRILINNVLKEIEERKKLERLTKKMKNANLKLENANRKLKKIDQAKSEFLSIASHQLRTPLTVIKGYISMIREGFYGQMPEKTKIPLENVYISTEKLVNLINDFLNFSKLEAGKIELKIEESSIEEIITSLIGELKIEAERKNLKLSWEKPKNPLPKLLIDKDKIRQVFINLIDNAIKYTKEGSITIYAKHIILNSHKRDKVIIGVKDTGEGITKEDHSKIFESFSRGRAGTKLYTSGSGLGLYICKQFINMHHGRIWVESSGKYKGSTFYVELSV